MASSGPNSPTSTVDTNFTGKAWSNVNNSQASDNAYATVSVAAPSATDYIDATTFGFAIPAGSVIDGIVVEVERKAAANSASSWATDATGGTGLRIIKGGTAGGTDHADTVTKWPTSDAYATYGSSSDLWGQTLTATDVNATNFGVRFAAQMFRTGKTAPPLVSVDHIRLTVYYHSADVSATATAATGTGAANAAVPTVSPSAGNAAGTGAALAPGKTLAVPIGSATGTGAANNAAPNVGPSAGNAAGTGVANAAAASLKPSAGNAAGTGAANAAALSIKVNAGLASGTGAANNAIAGVFKEVNPTVASGTGAANNVTTAIATTAGLASGTGVTGSSANVGPNASAATGTGAALDATKSLGPTAPVAAGTGAANQPGASIMVYAGLASGTGAALDAQGSVLVQAIATAAAGTGAANAPSVSLAPTAGLPAGTGAANAPGASVAPTVGLASGTGAALAASASLSVAAGNAAGTGIARAPSPSIYVYAQLASGSGAASIEVVSVVYAPRGLTGAVEYVAELFNSGATFGPSTKIGEIWDFRNLGWSRYDRLPGKGFMTLYQDSPHLSKFSPLVTHVRITRVTPSADVEVYNGQLVDYDSTGDDVILTCFDYISLLAVSRSGYRTLYPTKLLGTEIAQVEAQAAISKTYSPLGFVTIGTVEDPLGTDGITKIKTNSEFGLLDQMRLQVIYDLSEMGRANTINHTSFHISRTAPFTFDFWKNKGSLLTMGMILNGNVSDYDYLPNWGSYRNDLASLGTTIGGGATEIIKTNEAAAAVRGRRQDVATIKTVLGITSSSVEADQQQAATARMLQVAVQKTPALAVRLVRGTLVPFTGWDINDKFPVEIVNGIDNITSAMRLVGVRGLYTEAGEDLSVILEPVLT